MIDLAHKEVLPFLALLAFGNVLSGTDHADSASLGRGILEIRKTVSLHTPDLAVSPLNPVLDRIRFRIGGIERYYDSRPNPFYVVGMHPFRELFDVRLVFGNVVYFLYASIRPQGHPVERIVLPPPELGCVEGQLQTMFAHLRLLALDCKAHPGNEDDAGECQRDKQQQVRHNSRVVNGESPAWR